MAESFTIDWGISDTLRDFSSLRDTLGSSGGTASSLSALGGGLGIGDIRGAAEALHRATLSGQGLATASRYGLEIRPNEIGYGTDRGAMLMQALEGLRATAAGPGGRAAALADARNLNLEDWLGVVYLMDEQFQRIKQNAQASAEIMSPDRIAAAIMLKSELTLLDVAFKDLAVTVGSAVIPKLTEWTRTVADWARRLTGGDEAKTGLNDSLQRVEGALNQNTSQLRQMAGLWGGGSRAAMAIPAAYGPGRGHKIDDTMRFLAQGVNADSVKF